MIADRQFTCQEVVELVTAYLEDALVSADLERFEAHLVDCDGCRSYLEQMRMTIRLTGRLAERLPPELEARLLAALRARA